MKSKIKHLVEKNHISIQIILWSTVVISSLLILFITFEVLPESKFNLKELWVILSLIFLSLLIILCIKCSVEADSIYCKYKRYLKEGSQ